MVNPLPTEPGVFNAVSPRDIKSMIKTQLDNYAGYGLVENVEDLKSQVVVSLPAGSNSILATINLDVINVLDQVGVTQLQVG